MRKSNKKRARPTRKLGLPPGSLVHIGEIKTEKPSITLIEYDSHGITETRFEDIELSRAHHATREKMWLNVYGLHDPTVMAEIGRRLNSDQVSIVLGRNFVLTFQERATGAFEAVRERLRAEHGAMRAHGTDYLAYAILDTLVDRYFVMLDNLSDMAEDLEE